MNPAKPSITSLQIEIANAQTKRDIIKGVLEVAKIWGSLLSNQDILTKEERERFRANLQRLP